MATDQLPQLPEATRHEPIYQDPERHQLRIGGIVVGLRPLYTAEEATTYADARVAHALAADRARAVPVASGEVAVLAMVTFTMLGDLMGDEAPPEAVEFAKELYPRIDEIQEFAPDNADMLRAAMAHLRTWLSGAGAAPEQPADLPGQAATAAGEREIEDDAIITLAAESGLGEKMNPIGLQCGAVFHTASAYRTDELLTFARELLARASLSTPASGEGPAKVWLLADVSEEHTTVHRAFLSDAEANDAKRACEAYEQSFPADPNPDLPDLDAPDQEWEAYFASVRRWQAAHPVSAEHARGGMAWEVFSVAVGPLPPATTSPTETAAEGGA